MNPRYPIMAALVAAYVALPQDASSASSRRSKRDQTPKADASQVEGAPVRSAGRGGVETPTCPPNLEGETNAINILTKLLNCEASKRIDVGQKLATFVLSTDDSGPRFVTRQVLETPAAAQAVTAAALSWAQRAPGAEVAELYSLIGDAEPPAWVRENPVLRGSIRAASADRNDCRNKFGTGLRNWRHSNGREGKISATGTGEAGVPDNVAHFLSEAAKSARELLQGTCMLAAITANIDRNEREPVVPGGVGGRRAPGGSTAQYSDAALYREGGAFGRIWGPGDRNSAEYTVKLETRRSESGDIATNIVVYDLTGASPAFIQRFPITTSGETPFSHGGNRWPLVLDVRPTEGGDLAIMVRRPEDRECRTGIRTSANALARARLNQAVEAGQVSTFGGEEFRVFGQGGSEGSYLYYDERTCARASDPDANWSDLTPKAVAVVARIGPDGRFVRVGGMPEVGNVRGQPYRLEFDEVSGRWGNPKPGQGTRPTPPAASGEGSAQANGGAPAGPNAPNAPNAANTTQGEGSGSPQPASTGNETCDRLIAEVRRTQGDWQIDEQAEQGLSAELKNQCYRIVRARAAQGNQPIFGVFTPPNHVAGNLRNLGGVSNLRVVSHYIVYEMEDRNLGPVAVYEDMLRARRCDSDDTENGCFATAGQISGRGRADVSFTGVFQGQDAYFHRDHEVLKHALKNYLGYSDANINTIVQRVTARAGQTPYALQAMRKQPPSVKIEVQGSRPMNVWPNIQTSDAAPADNPPTEGPPESVVMEPARSADPGGPFPETMPFNSQAAGPNQTLEREVMLKGGGTALYRLRTSNPAHQEWYLFAKYKNGNRTVRLGPELVFTTRSGDAQVSRPRNLSIFSFATRDMATPTAMLARMGDANKGAYVLYRFPPSSPNDRQHCIGPVLAWGVAGANPADVYRIARAAICERGRL